MREATCCPVFSTQPDELWKCLFLRNRRQSWHLAPDQAIGMGNKKWAKKMYHDEFCFSGDNNYTSITISFPFFFSGNIVIPLDFPPPAPCSYHRSQCRHLSTMKKNCQLKKVLFPSQVSPNVWLQWVGHLEDEYLGAEHVFSCHIYQDLLICTLGLAMQLLHLGHFVP